MNENIQICPINRDILWSFMIFKCLNFLIDFVESCVLDRKVWTRIVTVSGRGAPTARRGHSALAVSGSLIVSGGCNEHRLLGDMWSFNFAAKVWTKISLFESCCLSHHIAISFPSVPTGSPISPTTESCIIPDQLLVAENHFSSINHLQTDSSSYTRYDSQECLIPSPTATSTQPFYDNEAIELTDAGHFAGNGSSHRKVTRNTSASSEKASRDKAKKAKVEENHARASMRSLTNVEYLRTAPESLEIELDVFGRTPLIVEKTLPVHTAGRTTTPPATSSQQQVAPTRILLIGGS